jgi:hypothetical protein
MDSLPLERDFDAVFGVDDLDEPEGLWFEVPDTIISVDDKAKGWELTGACLCQNDDLKKRVAHHS